MASTAAELAAHAAQGFQILECNECARQIQKALTAAGHHGQLVQIRGIGGRDFMICLSHEGGRSTITQNGRHVGVRVEGLMFDNLHPNGVLIDQWLKDFDALGGVAVESVIDF